MKSRHLDINNPLRLEHDGMILGTLDVLYTDQPIFICTFAPTATYNEVRSLFEEDAQIRSRFRENVTPATFAALLPPVEASIACIKALGLRLVAANGWTEDFTLNIDGTRAQFRYGECTIVADDAASNG